MLETKNYLMVSFVITIILGSYTYILYSNSDDTFLLLSLLTILFGYISLVLGRVSWKNYCNNISYVYYSKPQDLDKKYDKNSGLIFINETYNGKTDLDLTIPYVIFENINFNNAQIDLIKLSKKNKITKSIKFINCKGTVNLVFTNLDFLVVENNSTSKLNINVSNYESKKTSIVNVLILAKNSRVSITAKTNYNISYYLVNIKDKSHLILSRQVFIANITDCCHNIFYLLLEDKAALHIDKSIINMNCAHICIDDEVNIYSHGFLFDEESYCHFNKSNYKEIFTETADSSDAHAFIVMRDDILNNRFIRKTFFGKKLSFNESCQFYADFCRKTYFWIRWGYLQRIHFNFSPSIYCNDISRNTNINLGLRLDKCHEKEDTLIDHNSYNCVQEIAHNYSRYSLYITEDDTVERLKREAQYYEEFWDPFLKENSEYLDSADCYMINLKKELINNALKDRIKPEKPNFTLLDLVEYINS
ncbi:MAG: hypothetical protein MJ244_02855 [Clostridia bacterium]|nr:hypothetical protein [Clostridia bacterium]